MRLNLKILRAINKSLNEALTDLIDDEDDNNILLYSTTTKNNIGLLLLFELLTEMDPYKNLYISSSYKKVEPYIQGKDTIVYDIYHINTLRTDNIMFIKLNKLNSVDIYIDEYWVSEFSRCDEDEKQNSFYAKNYEIFKKLGKTISNIYIIIRYPYFLDTMYEYFTYYISDNEPIPYIPITFVEIKNKEIINTHNDKYVLTLSYSGDDNDKVIIDSYKRAYNHFKKMGFANIICNYYSYFLTYDEYIELYDLKRDYEVGRKALELNLELSNLAYNFTLLLYKRAKDITARGDILKYAQGYDSYKKYVVGNNSVEDRYRFLIVVAALILFKQKLVLIPEVYTNTRVISNRLSTSTAIKSKDTLAIYIMYILYHENIKATSYSEIAEDIMTAVKWMALNGWAPLNKLWALKYGKRSVFK